MNFWSSVNKTFENRAFVVLLGIAAFQIKAGTFAQSTDYYLLVYYMFAGDIVEGAKWKWILSVAYAVVGILTHFSINAPANLDGKRTSLAIIFGMVSLGSIEKWLSSLLKTFGRY